MPLQTSNLVAQLIQGCCFPAITALRQREQYYMQLMVAGQAQPQAAAPHAADGSGAPTEAAAEAMQLLQARLLAVAAGTIASAQTSAELVVAAARAQAGTGAGGSSREAAFELLLDLVTHDSGCWQQVSGWGGGTARAGGCMLVLGTDGAACRGGGDCVGRGHSRWRR